jgi:hypothetical protein
MCPDVFCCRGFCHDKKTTRAEQAARVVSERSGIAFGNRDQAAIDSIFTRR